LEREETFELPAAARDRFFMEISINAPNERELQRDLMFNLRFQNTDELIENLPSSVVAYDELNRLATAVQNSIRAELPLQDYALNLWNALRNPTEIGLEIEDVDITRLIAGGASPRGMGMLMRAARCRAWLEGRDYLTPDDIRAVFHDTVAHRIFFTPAYELRRDEIAPRLIEGVLGKISAP